MSAILFGHTQRVETTYSVNQCSATSYRCKLRHHLIIQIGMILSSKFALDKYYSGVKNGHRIAYRLSGNSDLVRRMHMSYQFNSTPCGITTAYGIMYFSHKRLRQWLAACCGVTKAPFFNFPVSKIFNLAKVSVRFFESRSYLTGVIAAELRRHPSVQTWYSIANVCFGKIENWGK